MRSCVIKIDNEAYVPVRSITYCTAGQFSPLDVMCLLSDPESYAVSDFSADVVPFVVANGNLIYQAPNVLYRFRSNLESAIANGDTYLEQVSALPPGMVVKATNMRNLNAFFDNLTISNETVWTKSHNNNYAWHDAPFMTTEEEEVVFAGFEKLSTVVNNNPSKERKNSRNKTLIEAEKDLVTLTEFVKNNGAYISLDPLNVPYEMLVSALATFSKPFRSHSLETCKDYLQGLGCSGKSGKAKKSEISTLLNSIIQGKIKVTQTT